MAEFSEDELPMAIQIFGAEPPFMARGAAILCERRRPTAIDINMGCPVRKIVSNGEGSALMRSPLLAGEIIEAVVRAVDVPVTVKIRAGWDSEHKNAVELARIAEASGASAICVHGRTRDQFYSPGVDRQIIGQVKASVSIPVIGNGDIYGFSDAFRMISETGCDGIMIGRGAMGNPWIFEEISAGLAGKVYEKPSVSARLAVASAHLASMIEDKGERVGLAEAKKHMAWYLQGMRGSATARSAIMQATSAEEIVTIFTILEAQN